MTTTPQRPSAKIYPFPVGGRRSLDVWKARIDARPEPVVTPPAINVVIDSWYHEDALRDTKLQ